MAPKSEKHRYDVEFIEDFTGVELGKTTLEIPKDDVDFYDRDDLVAWGIDSYVSGKLGEPVNVTVLPGCQIVRVDTLGDAPKEIARADVTGPFKTGE